VYMLSVCLYALVVGAEWMRQRWIKGDESINDKMCT